jgi:hypothetical protein
MDCRDAAALGQYPARSSHRRTETALSFGCRQKLPEMKDLDLNSFLPPAGRGIVVFGKRLNLALLATIPIKKRRVYEAYFMRPAYNIRF